jgi:putative transposase
MPFEMYARLQSSDAMPRAARRDMVRDLSTGDENVVDMARDGCGVAKASVGSELIQTSATELKAHAERPFDGQLFPIVLIVGVECAGMVVAMGITEDGTNWIFVLRQGTTESAAVCTALLKDLHERGMEDPADAVSATWLQGDARGGASDLRQNDVIQRCLFHKKRSVKSNVREQRWPELDLRLDAGCQDCDYEAGNRSLEV